jgi:hypothetical protein
VKGFFKIGSCELFPQAGIEPPSFSCHEKSALESCQDSRLIQKPVLLSIKCGIPQLSKLGSLWLGKIGPENRTEMCLSVDSKSELNSLYKQEGRRGVQMKDYICTNHSTAFGSTSLWLRIELLKRCSSSYLEWEQLQCH